MIAALRLQGAQAPWLFDEPMDGELFLAWVKQGLAPVLQRDDLVVLDNLATHKVAGVREAIADAGARLEYLPPYSPDSHPIENLWSKVKQGVKNRNPARSGICSGPPPWLLTLLPPRLPRLPFTRWLRHIINVMALMPVLQLSPISPSMLHKRSLESQWTRASHNDDRA